MCTDKLETLIKKNGADKIAYVRIETGTNAIGGQPRRWRTCAMCKVCDKFGLMIVFDASLLADNLRFIKAESKRPART